jgi:hypothetical protein
MIFCDIHHHLKCGAAKNTKKSGLKPIKTISHVFCVMETAIKRDLRLFNEPLIDFMRLGEGFYFSLYFGVF